jgi:hypothetical protein
MKEVEMITQDVPSSLGARDTRGSQYTQHNGGRQMNHDDLISTQQTANHTEHKQ